MFYDNLHLQLTYKDISSTSISGDAAAQSASALASKTFPIRLSLFKFGHIGREAKGLIIGNSLLSIWTPSGVPLS